jgi:hypothetical protein
VGHWDNSWDCVRTTTTSEKDINEDIWESIHKAVPTHSNMLKDNQIIKMLSSVFKKTLKS